MNLAHFHLIVNHIPLYGFIFSFLLLFSGLISNNRSIINLSLIVFIIVGLLTLPAFFSGEGAEEILLKVEPDAKSFIHYHEESAQISLWLSVALGFSSLIVFLINLKKDFKFLYYLILLLSILVIASLANTNNLGGKIRHSEIRETEILYNHEDD